MRSALVFGRVVDMASATTTCGCTARCRWCTPADNRPREPLSGYSITNVADYRPAPRNRRERRAEAARERRRHR